MNNKKLFKGALVLFASILMAVSCSAGDKTGGDANGGGGSTGGDGNGGTGTEVTEITKANILSYMQAFGVYTPTASKESWTFSSSTVTDIDKEVALTGSGEAGASAGTVKGDAQTAGSITKFLTEKFADKKLTATVTVADYNTGDTPGTANKHPFKVTVKLAPADNTVKLAKDAEKFATTGTGIIIKLIPNGNWDN